MVYFVQILYTIVFIHCQTAGVRNSDGASPSINLARQALSENVQNSWTHGVFCLNFVCFHIIILTRSYQKFCGNKMIILPLALKRFISQ